MVYETDRIRWMTTLMPRLFGVELVVIGFELVGFGLGLGLGLELEPVGFGLGLELELVGFGLGLELEPVGFGLGLGFGVELVVIGFEPVGFGFELVVIGFEPVVIEIESELLFQVRGLYSCVLRMPPHPVEFCHYYQ